MNYTIFRIEHKTTGIGPFQTNDPFTQELAAKAAQQPSLPPPGDDGLGLADIPWSWRFGCTSRDQLKRWMLLTDCVRHNRQVLRQLASRGFVLAVYTVHIRDLRKSLSGVQVAFDALTSKREQLVRYDPLQDLLA